MSKKDAPSTEPYKGVRDFYPEDQAILRYFIRTAQKTVERFGYEEYHASILEPAELYRGKTSQEIITEQVYSFTDRGGREVMLRPEMTPTIARMVAARRREMGFPLRLYSIPNVFRYERPQRGRVREHWQLNIDLFGSKVHEAEAEIIAIAHATMRAFGAKDSDFTIRIGSRTFLNTLIEHYHLSEEQARAFRAHLDARAKMPLDEFESGLRTLGIPLEALSSSNIPEDVENVLSLLRAEQITNAVFAPDIVRGFDYYTGIVFEVFDTDPQNTRSLFGGGRYDNLLAMFDEEPVPAVGFGMGDVTLRDFLETHNLLPQYIPATQLYISIPSSHTLTEAQLLAQRLRDKGINVAIDFGEKKLSDQIRTADKHHIPYLIVVGESEIQAKRYQLRKLSDGSETTCTEEELVSKING